MLPFAAADRLARRYRDATLSASSIPARRSDSFTESDARL
jgi:hypothetical protein